MGTDWSICRLAASELAGRCATTVTALAVGRGAVEIAQASIGDDPRRVRKSLFYCR